MKPLSDCHVLVTATSYGRSAPHLKRELETAVGRVTYNPTGKPLTSAQLQELLPDVDGFIAGLDEINAAAIAAAPHLRIIARYGVGINNVDLAAARAQGIVVTNTPGANAASVAELTIGLLLNLLRPIQQAAAETRQGGWPRLPGVSLVGKTVGLVGLGAIGKEVARRLAGFDCTVLAYDVVADADFARRRAITLVTLDDLLAQSDVVSLHVPVLPETRQMVNDAFLRQMKPGAYLINTSRGELVDEAALLDALTNGRLAGAALDAFQQEPPGADNPLLALPQVIPTPHMGAHSDGATNAMGRMALDDCLAVLRGEEAMYRI
ncbi:MAG: phosphoglycerate dehydrogenase [Chloroflexi bacterium]|nr:phosphoglycerate dehydrogenase [Chloroflexota bacterium]